MRGFILLVTILIFFSTLSPLYSSTLIAEYLCELGLKLYQKGELFFALEKFKRALEICPGYEPALEYIDIIQKEISIQPPSKPTMSNPLIKKPDVEEIPQPERLSPVQPQELEGLIELATKNNQPTQIAAQEIELAQLKIREAERNLFPALKLESYTTDGEVYKVKYEERELKAQLDQPLYYGGRLKDTLEQSKVNLEITKRNYDRLRIDVSHKTEVAYYNLMGSQMNLRAQEKIQQEAKRILDIVQKQFEAELVTPLEISAGQSWYEQITFQVNSIKHDIAMAELSFIQVLNVPKLPPLTLSDLEIKELELDLNECLEIGLKYRPEIELSKLMVKFNEYGKKIEESKNRFTIDLTSSYGRYQGRWKTEEMHGSGNWYVGIKATKPWGASTITTSATTSEVEPKFGEKYPTMTRTIKTEFNLLNNLSRLSEKKKAEIDFARSISDLNETTKTINFEIKDAYLNYQKALLQATTAQSEAKYRHHEVEVLKARAQVGEIGYSSVMEVLINLSRAQTTYTQALANYFISLANLKKAAGYGIKI